METPPQFTPSGGPPKKSNTVLIVVLVVLGLSAVCCAGGVFFVYSIGKKALASVGCITHYQFARKALSDYAADHNGKLPPAASWQDDIVSYYGKGRSGEKINGAGLFGDPSGDLGCQAQEGSPATGIAFNEQLANMSVEKAKEHPSDIILFEVPQVGRNICMKYKVQTGESPNKMMGAARQWITIPVNGSMNVSGSTQQSSDAQGMNGL